jgi:hypothetical protein
MSRGRYLFQEVTTRRIYKTFVLEPIDVTALRILKMGENSRAGWRGGVVDMLSRRPDTSDFVRGGYSGTKECSLAWVSKKLFVVSCHAEGLFYVNGV